jgi:hypothetical protein
MVKITTNTCRVSPFQCLIEAEGKERERERKRERELQLACYETKVSKYLEIHM